MKRLLILLILLFALPAYAEQCTEETPCPELARLSPAMMGSVPVAAPPAGQTFSDNFDRTNSDSLGANWTEVAGDADISSNTLLFVTGSYGTVVVKHNTALSTVNQYMKFKSLFGNQYIGAMFRYTNSASSYYIIAQTGATNWGWFSYTGDGAGETQEGADTELTGQDLPDNIGITVVGTGTDTVVRVWREPTGDAPDAGGATWGSAAPIITWTSNPSNAVNTGAYIGFAGSQATANTLSIDDFFGGDIS